VITICNLSINTAVTHEKMERRTHQSVKLNPNNFWLKVYLCSGTRPIIAIP